MFIRLLNDGTKKYPYTTTDLRYDNPQVSFPENPSNDTLAEFGVYPCEKTLRPEISYTQNLVQLFEQISGVWTQVWTITDASAEEIAQRLANQWASVRSDRNERLANSDWTQLADAPVDDLAWAVYRQALRDITTQTDPFNIVWPISP